MKRSYFVGLSLVAVLAGSAFAVSSAFALESTWLVSGAKSTTAVNVDSEGEILLEDMKGGIFGESIDVLCKVLGLGTGGQPSSITSITLEECETMSGVCPSPIATALNLPWNIKIELIGTAFYNGITAAAGEVGYNFSCSGFVDTCATPLGRALDKENSAGGAVLVEFNTEDVNQPSGSCTKGGIQEALVQGTQTVLVEETGLAVAFSEG
ncbi:MAG: hypothetical protein WAN93_00320 [Solirubrobacteraceae bacterium]